MYALLRVGSRTKCKPICILSFNGNSFGNTTFNPADTVHTPDQINLGHITFSGGYHTFGIDWRPDKIDFYYDGSLFRTSNVAGIFPNKLNEMHMIIDINHPTLGFDVLVDTVNTIFPFEYTIDYVRCWQYKQYCDSVLNQCNFNSATFDPALYKQISVGGSGCNASIPSGKNISFRANDFVLLQEGFEVQVGAEFLGEITPCYEYVNPNRSAPPITNPFYSPFLNKERIKKKHQ